MAAADLFASEVRFVNYRLQQSFSCQTASSKQIILNTRIQSIHRNSTKLNASYTTLRAHLKQHAATRTLRPNSTSTETISFSVCRTVMHSFSCCLFVAIMSLVCKINLNNPITSKACTAEKTQHVSTYITQYYQIKNKR